jgi:hypothetical protein
MNPVLLMHWLKRPGKSTTTSPPAKVYFHHSGESRNSVFSISIGTPALAGVAEIESPEKVSTICNRKGTKHGLQVHVPTTMNSQ